MKNLSIKNLRNFKKIMGFLSAAKIAPSVEIFALPDAKWTDLVLLAREWAEQEKEIGPPKQAPPPLTPEQREEETRIARIEGERLLYHSAGYRPKVQDV